MIQSFRHKGLRDFYLNGRGAGVRPDLQKRVRRILDALNQARVLTDLAFPGRCAPGRAKRGRVVRGRRRSGRVAAGHLQGQRHAVQLLWTSLLCAGKAHGSSAGRPRHLVAERRDNELR
jgi:hypothetical protein